MKKSDFFEKKFISNLYCQIWIVILVSLTHPNFRSISSPIFKLKTKSLKFG